MSGAAYANTLEQWFYSLPSLVQEVLHEPFSWMNDALKAVAGNPEELLAAIPQYQQYAAQVRALGDGQRFDRGHLNSSWSGDAHDAFNEQLTKIETQLAGLADAIGEVTGLLESGAKATVDGANMIIDIVTGLIMLALGTIAVNVALSVITLGTSLAAGAAMVIAQAAVAVARVARVMQKVAQILMKLADLFRKLSELLKSIVVVLKNIKGALKDAQALTKTAKGRAKVQAMVDFGVQKAMVSGGISAVTLGAVQIPGTGGELYSGGKEYVQGWRQATDAKEAVEE